jgi:hypothetical protein
MEMAVSSLGSDKEHVQYVHEPKTKCDHVDGPHRIRKITRPQRFDREVDRKKVGIKIKIEYERTGCKYENRCLYATSPLSALLTGYTADKKHQTSPPSGILDDDSGTRLRACCTRRVSTANQRRSSGRRSDGRRGLRC